MDLMTIKDTLCCSLLLLILLILPVHSEDKPATGDASIFSDLWSALTQTGKNPTCPGECVHAITSILCDHVLEEVSCGEPFLRCCVPNDSSYGTAVETSPPFDTTHTPLSEYSSSAPFSSTSQSLSSTQSSVSSSSSMMSAGLTSSTTPATFGTSSYLPWHTTMSSASSANYSTPFSLPTRHTSSHQSTITTTTERINSRCPGVCVASRYVRYCSNISTNGVCDHLTETCCLQSERDSTNITLTMIPNRNSSSIYPSSTATVSTSPSTTTTSTTTTSTTISSATSTASSSLSPSTTTTTNPPTTNESADKKDQNQGTTDLPICEGICVSPLFALLCDEVESNKVCSNGGTCCMNREQPAVTTPPSIPECTGTCIPTFLSGVCTRPSELVLKTSNCMSGTICCHFQDRRPVNERPPPLFNGPPLRIPPHPSSNYPSMGPPHPPNIQHFQRPNIQLKPASGLRPLPPMSLQPRPPNYAPFIPNRKPQIQIPSPMAPPQPQPSSSLPPPEPELNEPEPIASEPETSGSEENPSEMELSVGVSDGSETSGPVNGAFPGGVPFCPGPCIAPIFRFTCFGGNAIYPKFFCAKQGQICCAALSDIQNYEANIIANNGIWKPSIPSSPNNTTLDEASSMQSSTVVLPPIKPPPRQATPYSCGIKGTQRKESPRIVGGSDALPGEWCWQVALINTENQYICGGALIGSQWVLTAAHCITNLVRNGESIYIRVGDYDLSAQIKSKSAQTQKVSTTYIHHNHNGLTLDNDIALLKMASPVQINDSICLVCLPARGSNRKPGQRCTVTGYGYKDEAGPIALKVREAEVPVVDDQECTVKINAVTDKTFMLPASSFCAGGEEGNDACQGDGGGPMVCEVDGFYELTGLVSWGFGCGRQDVPGVYVKVSNFIGWINQIISVNNQ